jgi:hypothetical protein
VGYTTPMFSDVDDQLFAVFKSIVEDFSSDKEEGKDSYPEKGKHFFFGGKGCMRFFSMTTVKQ